MFRFEGFRLQMEHCLTQWIVLGKIDYAAQSTNWFSFIHINKGLLAFGNVISALGADQLRRFWRKNGKRPS
jgi:hypothetical protein